MRSKFYIYLVASLWALSALQARSQMWSMSGGFEFMDANDRAATVQEIDLQQKIHEGYYARVGNNVSYVTNDHSVGDISLTLADGASGNVDVRSGPESGTNSYAVGALNTTTVETSGSGNNLDISSTSDSLGCQDGSIYFSTTSGELVNIASNDEMPSLDEWLLSEGSCQ